MLVRVLLAIHDCNGEGGGSDDDNADDDDNGTKFKSVKDEVGVLVAVVVSIVLLEANVVVAVVVAVAVVAVRFVLGDDDDGIRLEYF